MESKILKRVVAGVVLVLAMGGYGYYKYREEKLNVLYEQIRVGDSTACEAALRELGTYKGATATKMLLTMARGRLPMWCSHYEVIQMLASRKDPSIAPTLANLLQPQYLSMTRHAAAEALLKLQCAEECVANVVHSLERISAGEPPFDERTIAISSEIKTKRMQRELDLHNTLYKVLSRNRDATNNVLADVYGVGTPAPSKFALDLISRMQFRDACPFVLESQRLLKDEPEDLFPIAPRAEVESTVHSLKCK